MFVIKHYNFSARSGGGRTGCLSIENYNLIKFDSFSLYFSLFLKRKFSKSGVTSNQFRQESS